MKNHTLLKICAFVVTLCVFACKKESNTIMVPVVNTGAINAVTQTTATCGGTVSSENGSAVVFRGTCWSTHPSPTISDSKSLDGAGPGTFTSKLTGLTDGATYYARAYATNGNGTSYGTDVIFTAIVIGENYQGGLIAYILQPGDPGYQEGIPHGLIAAAADGPQLNWAMFPNYVITAATATALGTGNDNTNAIVSKQTVATYAAKYCSDLVSGGHDDWFLPSKDELNKLYLNKKLLNMPGSYYWSSTELSSLSAWLQAFNTGNQSSTDKVTAFNVRAIRTF